MKAVLGNRLYVPSEHVTQRHLDRYTHTLLFEEEELVLENYREYEDYYGFCRGNISKILSTFRGFEIEDQRASNPFTYDVQFLATLRKQQQETYDAWMEKKFGIMQAPPRFGKTIWTINLICQLKERALILVHTEDLKGQWVDEFRKWTNVSDIEANEDVQLVGAWDNDKATVFPVATVATYQSFNSDRGRKYLKKHRNDFGFIAIDECHRGHAATYNDVINITNSLYRLGITATPYRSKDMLHLITHDALGPVVAVGTEEAMPVKCHYIKTNYYVKNFNMWAHYINGLAKSEDRNRLIAKWVAQDVRNGHHVLVTTERVKHCSTLKSMIIEEEPSLADRIGVLTSATKNREQLREHCRTGKYKVVIGMNKIVQEGYNVPRWSCLHNTMPTTNPENWYQRISRIRTHYTEREAEDYGEYDKPDPICRIYYDNGNTGAVWGYFNCVRKKNSELRFQEIDEVLQDPPDTDFEDDIVY